MMEAVLSNADHPEYGVATIPLPIPRNQYDHCVALLEALEIGDASEADCRLDSLDSAWPVLNRLVCTKVNLDELDYLAKRLDSFTVGEFSQFQAMAEKLNLASMKDLINLTFCCQQATVITDFTNLREIGRDHYMNIHGGCASMEELEQLDGEETAILLIEDNEGTVTRYGVVYDNGMQLSQLYDGKHLPCYHYEADMTAVGISSRWEPENSRNVTWIYLPASKGQIERAMQRSGIADPKDMRLFIADSSFPEEVDVALDFQCDNIHELNELALVVEKFSIHDRKKLGAAVSMAKPENASQIRRLAENMDLFEFAPGAHTPAEYGKYMIQKSGHFEYDPNLDEFYDYERYGLQHMGYQSGVFTDRGYIAYVGTVDLEELMAASKFREDLYYRLNIFPIVMPDLSKRKGDVMLLAEHFLSKFNLKYGKDIKRLSTPAINMLMAYHWPGNVRELENCMERAVITAQDDCIYGYNLPASLQMPSHDVPYSRDGEAPADLPTMVDSFERELIVAALKRSPGNMSAAARELGISPRVLHYKMHRLGLQKS